MIVADFRFDKIYYTLRCKLCNKTFPVHITKGQIINRTFKISNHINITVNPDRYYLFTNALRELYNEEFYKLKYCSTVVYMVPRA